MSIDMMCVSNLIKVPYYSSLVACGLFGITDDFAEQSLSLDEKFLSHHESTFFVRAGGDSMEPDIKAGDILIIDRSLPISNGQIAAFYYNGNAVCKQYLRTSKEIILRSKNPNYPDIIIQDSDDLQLFGVVTGLARDFL